MADVFFWRLAVWNSKFSTPGFVHFLESLGLGYRFKVRHPAIGTVLTETMLIAECDI
ncbi:MAG: hypothetical protein IJ899_18720 [Blautia sp.]|nr:hypothetical protein [Blautia sp.]